MISKAIASICVIFAIYVILYFSIRDITENDFSVQVRYLDSGYRQYILDNPNIDSKFESGTFDINGKRSYLMRLFIPIEIIEMKCKYNLRHY